MSLLKTSGLKRPASPSASEYSDESCSRSPSPYSLSKPWFGRTDEAGTNKNKSSAEQIPQNRVRIHTFFYFLPLISNF